jgi:hypothetical protein
LKKLLSPTAFNLMHTKICVIYGVTASEKKKHENRMAQF